MNIEVQGIGFPNKGAELMLAGVRQWMARARPGARLVMPSYLPYADRIRFGAWQKYWRDSRRFQHGRLAEFLPTRALASCGVVKDSAIDVLLDASGFAYGDGWGADKIHRRLSRYVAAWKRGGRKIILLPQAFGPFAKPETAREMRIVLEHADLVCPRDATSFEHLRGLGGRMDRVELFPDFTCLVEGEPPAAQARWAGGICLIPNHKLIEKGTEKSDTYVAFFAELWSQLTAAGERPYLLLHEGEADRVLCEAIRAGTGGRAEILVHEDPLALKALIGSARFVVTSRFHGFVSALSQGVPALATSWSHKYQMLAADYTRESIVVDRCDAAARERVTQLLRPADYDALAAEIRGAAAGQKRRAATLWTRVEAVLAVPGAPTQK